MPVSPTIVQKDANQWAALLGGLALGATEAVTERQERQQKFAEVKEQQRFIQDQAQFANQLQMDLEDVRADRMLTKGLDLARRRLELEQTFTRDQAAYSARLADGMSVLEAYKKQYGQGSDIAHDETTKRAFLGGMIEDLGFARGSPAQRVLEGIMDGPETNDEKARRLAVVLPRMGSSGGKAQIAQKVAEADAMIDRTVMEMFGNSPEGQAWGRRMKLATRQKALTGTAGPQTNMQTLVSGVVNVLKANRQSKYWTAEEWDEQIRNGVESQLRAIREARENLDEPERSVTKDKGTAAPTETEPQIEPETTPPAKPLSAAGPDLTSRTARALHSAGRVPVIGTALRGMESAVGAALGFFRSSKDEDVAGEPEDAAPAEIEKLALARALYPEIHTPDSDTPGAVRVYKAEDIGSVSDADANAAVRALTKKLGRHPIQAEWQEWLMGTR